MSMLLGYLLLGNELRLAIPCFQMFDAVQNISLLKGLAREQLDLLVPLLEPFSIPSDDVVFFQGDDATYLYLITQGTVAIRYKPYDGSEITLTHLGVGDVFGWSAVVGSATYTSTIVAETDVEALRIRGLDLIRLCAEHPQSSYVILDRLAEVVSPRWKHAKKQIHAMLQDIVNQGKEAEKFHAEDAGKIQYSKTQQLRGLIEQLGIYVEKFHGDSVEFVSFDGNRLRVRLGKAHHNRQISPAILHSWIVGTVHQFFPDVEVIDEA